MLKAARRIPGGVEHLTDRWEDTASLGRQEYAAMLSDSVFALCPVGNRSPDTFRFYEALETGAIPIAEDWGGAPAWKDMLSPMSLWRIKPWRERHWRSCGRKMMTRSYWARVFGGDFPCPRLCNWESLEATIRNIDAAEMSKTLGDWWRRRKAACRAEVASAVRSNFGLAGDGDTQAGRGRLAESDAVAAKDQSPSTVLGAER
jgi:hypothetical protein